MSWGTAHLRRILAQYPKQQSYGDGTNAAWEHLLVVDNALHPGHQMLDIAWSIHLGRLLEVFVVLPEVLESVALSQQWAWNCSDCSTYSSVAFISGQLCGEQNSVMAP
jgi:hypothetical protein